MTSWERRAALALGAVEHHLWEARAALLAAGTAEWVSDAATAYQEQLAAQVHRLDALLRAAALAEGPVLQQAVLADGALAQHRQVSW